MKYTNKQIIENLEKRVKELEKKVKEIQASISNLNIRTSGTIRLGGGR